MVQDSAIDDGTIRRLAAEPERPLFPLLGQAEAMAPLVIVLAFLPALYAVENRTLSENGAWEGLVSLRCATAAGLAEAVDPAALEPNQPFRFQPPLMTWLTALGLRLFGAGSAAGLVAAAYLCTAGAIISGYVLGRRLGGEPLGLLTAALLATHPQVLEGAQEPAPQSVSALLAILALAGAVAHWQKSSALASYQLLAGGTALGLCLLAGGPLALAIFAILALYIALWKLAARRRKRAGRTLDKTQFSRRSAFRSLLVMGATAFAVGGWHPLLMGSTHGLEFWADWFCGGTLFGDIDERVAGVTVLQSLRELNELAAPLAGVSILGLIGILRDLTAPGDDPAMRHRGLLLPWIAVGLALWELRRGSLGSSAPSVDSWSVLLAVPLMIAAAMGLIDIAERRVAFWPAVTAGMLTLADAILVLERGSASASGSTSNPEKSLLAGCLVLLVSGAFGSAFLRRTTSRDSKRRNVLSGLIFVLMFAQGGWGALAVRHGSRRDRELDELRSGLARLGEVKDWVLIAPPAAASEPHKPPPAQLLLTLQSLWPDSAMHPLSSWEAALAEISGTQANGKTGLAVYLTWIPRGKLRAASPPAELRSVAAPYLYGGLEITAYVREPATKAMLGNREE